MHFNEQVSNLIPRSGGINRDRARLTDSFASLWFPEMRTCTWVVHQVKASHTKLVSWRWYSSGMRDRCWGIQFFLIITTHCCIWCPIMYPSMYCLFGQRNDNMLPQRGWISWRTVSCLYGLMARDWVSIICPSEPTVRLDYAQSFWCSWIVPTTNSQ